jgi:hypothetical protein
MKRHALRYRHFSSNTFGMTEERVLASMLILIKEKE